MIELNKFIYLLNLNIVLNDNLTSDFVDLIVV